jgi:hypothetical protein
VPEDGNYLGWEVDLAALVRAELRAAQGALDFLALPQARGVEVVPTRESDALRDVVHRREAYAAVLVGLGGVEVDVAQGLAIVAMFSAVSARFALRGHKGALGKLFACVSSALEPLWDIREVSKTTAVHVVDV